MDDERPQVPEFADMLEAAAHHRWGCPICGGDHRADRCSAIPFRVEPTRLVLNCDEIKAFELRGAAELAAYQALIELEGEAVMVFQERKAEDGPIIVADRDGERLGRGETTIEALVDALRESAERLRALAEREAAKSQSGRSVVTIPEYWRIDGEHIEHRSGDLNVCVRDGELVITGGDLANECVCLPLAVVQAASKLAEVTEIIEQERERLMAERFVVRP